MDKNHARNNETALHRAAETILDNMNRIIAGLLDKSPERIDINASFLELGINSILAVELIEAVNKELDVSLGVEAVFDFHGPRALAGYIIDCLGIGSMEEKPERIYAGIQPSIGKAAGDSGVLNCIRMEISRLSGKNDLDMHMSFLELGINSILAVELIEGINNTLGISLGVETVFDYQGPVELAEYIKTHFDIDTFDCSDTEMSEGAINQVDKKADNVQKHKHTDEKTRKDIAIVGISGRFADCRNVEEFWRHLQAGDCCIHEMKREGWEESGYFDPDPGKKNKSISKWGGLIADADCFDGLFFSISPREAERMDPQQRVFMEEAYKAFEDGGYSMERLSGQKIGVFVGGRTSDYKELTLSEDEINPQSFLGNDMAILAARISYFLNLKGPGIAVDTACSSGLTAIHMACESIKRGECDMALAGAVFLMTSPEFYVMASKTDMLSPDGKCKTFDNSANGIVMGEGVGALVLKPVEAALEAGDHIYGVIKGTAMNQDGRTKGITAPSSISQKELLCEVYSKSGIHPESIGYMEAHGTGTRLGDPIEVKALTEAFRCFTDKKQYCVMGSHKPNIGHTIMAAGLAGVFKILMSMKYNKIPPTINMEQPNQYIDFENSPFHVNTTSRPWPETNRPKRAGVSSFGFSGTNCHVILEEAPVVVATGKGSEWPWQLIPLSAATEEALMQKMKELSDWLEQEGKGYSFEDMAYTLQRGRSHLGMRIAIIAGGKEDLREKLIELLEKQQAENCLSSGKVKNSQQPELDEQSKKLILELKDTDMAGQTLKEKLRMLADMYIKGYTIDFESLYVNKAHNSIPMPVYPFARERRWVKGRWKGGSYNGNSCNPSELFYYCQQWEKTDVSMGAEMYELPDNILVFDKNDVLWRQLKGMKRRAGTPTPILVMPGHSFRNAGRNIYEINPQSRQDYIQLLNALKLENIMPRHILHLWGADKDLIPKEQAVGNSDTYLSGGVYSLFHLIKAFIEIRIKTKIKLVFMYNNDRELCNPYGEAVSGYSKSMGMILPGLSLGTVGLTPGFEAYLPDIAIKELKEGNESESYWDGNTRYIRTIKPLTLNDGGIRLRHRGVYLITGGAGGLGICFAEYLARKYQARLVLVGRSSLGVQKQEILRNIRDCGGEALYIQANVGSRSDILRVMEEVRQSMGPLNGVIHAAGIFDERLLPEKDIEDFKACLEPKIDGVINLDEATAGEPLDFFAMFSSTSSILGDFGQCDYAIGNRFLDGYVRFREILKARGIRKGKTLSLNWSLWRNGGIHLNKDGEALYLQSSGISYIETRSGISAFEELLGSSSESALVIAGNREKLEKILMAKKAEKDGCSEQAIISQCQQKPLNVKPVAGVEAPELETVIESDIKRMAASILMLEESRMDTAENLGSFGFDSINLKELADNISSTYGIALPPTIFYAHSTIKDLARYLPEEYEEELRSFYSAQNKIVEKQETDEVFRESLEAAEEPVYGMCEVYRSDEKRLYHGLVEKEPVAITGVSGILPGSENIEKFWDNLVNERDMITEIPKDRWDWSQYFSSNKYEENKTISRWGGFIDNIDKFDAAFFNISRREAELMDPQHRILLETVWRAIEDGGYKASQLWGRNIGVYVGVQFNDYQRLLDGIEELQAQTGSGNAHALLCNRISYLLNLKGPSESIDTACSSSLVALYHGVRAIQSGECEMAIAGGVNAMLTPNLHVVTSQMGILSPDGRCKTFDKSANGYVRGEGVGALILKPLSRAVADRDNIYAVIRGTAVNHGGKANSLTAPNSEAQAAMLVSAYEEAGFDPGTIGYIEAHGTGTELGDPVEIEGLRKAFNELAKRQGKPICKTGYCGLGSVKTNIGHLEPAAGMAGILKLILAMKHKVLPGNLHLKEINPYINIQDSPFYIVRETKAWDCLTDENGQTLPRRAGISSFGFGGTNAHVVLEEYTEACDERRAGVREPQLILLSAKNEERLKTYGQELLAFISRHGTAGKSQTMEAEWRKAFREDLVRMTAGIINVCESDISLESEIGEYSFDPVRLANLINMINDTYGLDMSPDMINEISCFEDMAKYMEDKYRAILCRYSSKCSSVSVGASADHIALEDLAYTLQTGRESMEERLAFVVSHMDELKEKLSAFCRGEYEKAGIYRGNVKPGKGTAGLLIKGRAGKEFLRIVIEEKELEQLAQLWTSGIEIDWMLLHREHGARRVSLPTYPFARDSYWIPAKKSDMCPEKLEGKMFKGLHPMLDFNSCTLKKQEFTKCLTGNEFYMSDHRVAGRKTLPGVAFIEMARAAGMLWGECTVKTIKNIIWAKPVIVENRECEVYIALKQRGNEAEYEVCTSGSGGERVVHSQGRVCFEEGGTSGRTENMEAVRKRCKVLRSREECYKAYDRRGLQYGSSFRPIEELYIGQGEAFSRLLLPIERKAGFSSFVLHPSLLDGALQTVIGLMEGVEEDVAYLPFAMGEINIMRAMTEECWALARKTANGKENSGVMRFDIDIMDKNGNIQVSIKNFTARAMSRNEANMPAEMLYFDSVWQETALVNNKEDAHIDETIVLFCDRDDMTDNLKAKAGRVIQVKSGAAFCKTGSMVYEINPMSADDYCKLMDMLTEQGSTPCKLVHMWSHGDFTGIEALEKQMEKGLYSMLYLSQAILRQKCKEKLMLLYVYISGEDGIQPQYGAVDGFVKTFWRENPGLDYRVLEASGFENMDNAGCALLADMLLGELASDDRGQAEIRYEGAVRYVRRYRGLKAETDGFTGGVKLKEDGVYLVTGGMGGLGLKLARHIVQKSVAGLVLAGRSKYRDEWNEELEVLRQYNAQVVYMEADITDRRQARELVERIKQRFGKLNGIIHAAGIIKDSLVSTKTHEAMETVMAPKVQGTIYLDEAAGGEPLDFFIMFSSVSGIMGNIGQCDYAYANRFMDYYAIYRNKLVQKRHRSGSSLSISWPLWKNGGMKVDEQSAVWLEKSIGMSPLSTVDGLKAFELAMKINIPQIAVIYGNRRKCYEQLGIIKPAKSADKLQSRIIALQKETCSIHKPVIEKVEEDLLRLCAELLKVREADIDREEPLSDYGLDSIMMMTMMNRIESLFGEVIEPNAISENNTVRRLAGYLIEHGMAKAESEAAANMEPVDEPLWQEPAEWDIKEGYESVGFLKEERKESIKPGKTGKIAVIGTACRFPKSNTPEAFWENLKNGVNMITEVPEGRWKEKDYYSSDKKEPCKTYTKWGGFIDNIYYFDAEYFGVSQGDAKVMDPHHRLLLELSDELLNRSGYGKAGIDGTRTGIFIGGGESSYVTKGNGSHIPIQDAKHMLVNTIQNMMAARIADFYNLKGSAQIIDTACSSSLVAIHHACRSIRTGECEMAIAGGVELLTDPYLHIGFSKAEVLSDEGCSYIFDERAKGFVIGEGGGLVLLKDYEAAVRDGDMILGVILGSAVNNDGHTTGLTVPSLEGQKEVIAMALEDAGISGDSITCLEAHGTGTLLGDPIEIRAASQVYGSLTEEKQYCAVGSVKSNMGHLLRAAGVASFIKMVLALGHKQIPPTLNCTKPHPRFRFKESPFYPITEHKEWVPGNGIRRGAISSFGFGGTNCHMILEEFKGEDGYKLIREPLPSTNFKRRLYCLGQEAFTESGTTEKIDESLLMTLLEDLQSGRIDSQKAFEMIELNDEEI